MVHFYREYEGEQQRIEEQLDRNRKNREREEVLRDYRVWLEKMVKTKTIQPGESMTIESPFFDFDGGCGDTYKAEIYLGNDTWVQICITPPIGYLKQVDLGIQNGDNAFWYAKEGANQHLYLKMDGEFKRVCEIKRDTKPKHEGDTVTFTSPEGVQKRIKLVDAKQTIHAREQHANQKDEKVNRGTGL
jgi:hypothetical protein